MAILAAGMFAVISCGAVLRILSGTAARSPLLVTRARELVGVLGTQVAPAATAGLLVYMDTGQSRAAFLVLLAVFTGCWSVARFAYPRHLMPASRLLLAAAGPGLGVAVVILLGPTNGVSPYELSEAAIVAMLIAAVGRSTEARFEAERPVVAAVIGSSSFAASFARGLNDAGIRSYRLAGWLSAESRGATPTGEEGSLGVLSDVRSVVIDHRVELLVCAPAENGESVGVPGHTGPDGVSREVTRSCLDLPVRMIDANQLHEELLGHVPIANIDAAWFRYIMHPRYRASSPLFKRLLDLTGAVLGGVLALPILALSALAIKLQDGGPLLYRQRRVGERGREFEMLKLRTMRTDAESDGRARWSSEDDTRVTAVGRLLRRTHVDELPQLWNVLSGEMALVGPRPERPELVSRLERQFPHYERRHLVKPGITGWAQVRCGYSGSDLGTAWKLSHDLYYLKHRTLVTDLMLLVETAVSVVGRTNRLPAPGPALAPPPAAAAAVQVAGEPQGRP
ncbi:MAG TPA: exopolysaccharide biosynthesis polyprenyl glycosylphosphotransferase [Solirubrobacterales bacterium]|nr:exopolysaccharide biosynthesis polyprenyl glycosylphosphotransferase [Solirubrobacterales bacterium]